MVKCRIDEVKNALLDEKDIDVAEAIKRKLWTSEYIGQKIGMSRARSRGHLLTLEGLGLAHVIGYTPRPGPAPIWAKGPGQRPPMPRGLTADEYARRCRNLENAAMGGTASMELLACSHSRKLTYQTIERAKANPQSWFGQLEQFEAVE